MINVAILHISAAQNVILIFVFTEYDGQTFNTPDLYLIYWFRNPTHLLIVWHDVPWFFSPPFTYMMGVFLRLDFDFLLFPLLFLFIIFCSL